MGVPARRTGHAAAALLAAAAGAGCLDRVRIDRSSDGAEIAAFDFESDTQGFGTAFDQGGTMASEPVPAS